MGTIQSIRYTLVNRLKYRLKSSKSLQNDRNAPVSIIAETRMALSMCLVYCILPLKSHTEALVAEIRSRQVASVAIDGSHIVCAWMIF